MNYQLIALDVDGTLLNDQHQITEQTKATIWEAYERGCKIVLCTGRGPDNALPILQQLEMEGTMITHNGSATVHADERGQSVLHEYTFALNEIVPLVEYARREGIHFDVCTSYNMYIERLDERAKQMYIQYGVNPKRVADVIDLQMPLVKMTLSGPAEALDRVQREWDELKLYGSLRMLRSGDFFIDIMNPAASKGNALRELAASWSIGREHVLAIGNYYNDIDMLTFAGLGIAVANSPDEVKAAAAAVVSSNNDEGVHEAIQRYVLEENV
ncbi:HAD family phosphatase [Paenibacillus athensensis]|uniref:Hydrolase n=1 Tax=Paenibacillus athensensis TaxID=1967502 RepID=A0A4Y8Q9P3_9BACL|nr:HAD family hydrolase [Paenibacillus athensensis]MCD1259107.1 HAD family phosphatase [Paenibacillus athensensis]